jgi:hypothetical protein
MRVNWLALTRTSGCSWFDEASASWTRGILWLRWFLTCPCLWILAMSVCFDPAAWLCAWILLLCWVSFPAWLLYACIGFMSVCLNPLSTAVRWDPVWCLCAFILYLWHVCVLEYWASAACLNPVPQMRAWILCHWCVLESMCAWCVPWCFVAFEPGLVINCCLMALCCIMCHTPCAMLGLPLTSPQQPHRTSLLVIKFNYSHVFTLNI